MLSVEATIHIFKVFGLAQLELQPMIYLTLGANHNTINAVLIKLIIKKHTTCTIYSIITNSVKY
jgi:hypothetical protein